LPIAAQLEGQLTITPQMDDGALDTARPSIASYGLCVTKISPWPCYRGAEGEQSPEGNPLGGWAA
tara:strand:+ start:2052 stop:2246 length:195 start_codon:yes stop_codon:yes gene_type:complete